MVQAFDVVVCGGAVTGSVLALALSSVSQHKMRIAIIEKTLPAYEQQGGFDARSIALAQGNLQKLAQIRPLMGEDLATLLQKIATPIQQILVSDKGHFGKTTLTASDLGLPQLGVVVELAQFGQALLSMIANQPNIVLFCPDEIVKSERTLQECRFTLASGVQLSCQLAIAADGIQSSLAQQFGVETAMLRDYQQSAVIANVKTSQAHQGRAFERFTEQGPLALLPLTEHYLSLVWCTQDPENLLSLSDEHFLQQLQHQFGWKLGKFLQVSRRYSYPLMLRKAERHIHHRLAIVGNAAQLLHPVAGQGFNLGLRDLFELANLIGKAYQQQQDLGCYDLLRQYEKHRQVDQQKIMAQTNGLISIFWNAILPLQLLRNVGLFALDQNKFTRNYLANLALGWQ